MNNKTLADTGQKPAIAAVATPVGEGGIAVIRVSGKDAIAKVAACFRGAGGVDLTDPAAAPSHTVHFGTIHDRNGKLVEDPEKFQHMSRVCAEIDQLCQQLNLQLFDGPAIQQAESVARATGTNFSSMLQDVRHQRKTELDYITGYLLQKAKQAGLTLPENLKLYEHLKETTK